MIKKKHVVAVVSIVVLSFLVGTTFQFITMAADGGNPFDVLSEAIQDLQTQIDEIELLPGPPGPIGPQGPQGEQGLQGPPGGFGAPNFDSGWVEINTTTTVQLNHGLGTRSLFVYLIGKNIVDPWIGTYHVHQDYYGFDTDDGNTWGARWTLLDDNRIEVIRGAQDNWWHEFRVYIWVLP